MIALSNNLMFEPCRLSVVHIRNMDRVQEQNIKQMVLC